MRRFRAVTALAAALAVPIILAGCSSHDDTTTTTKAAAVVIVDSTTCGFADTDPDSGKCTTPTPSSSASSTSSTPSPTSSTTPTTTSTSAAASVTSAYTTTIGTTSASTTETTKPLELEWCVKEGTDAYFSTRTRVVVHNGDNYLAIFWPLATGSDLQLFKGPTGDYLETNLVAGAITGGALGSYTQYQYLRIWYQKNMAEEEWNEVYPLNPSDRSYQYSYQTIHWGFFSTSELQGDIDALGKFPTAFSHINDPLCA